MRPPPCRRPACAARRAVAVLGAAATACLAAACERPPPGVAVGRVGGGVLVAALDADPGHLNPAITTGGGVHTASELVYNGLVELDPSMEPTPGLAASWDVEDGGRRYRFHLRPDVRWHDGEPLTSADVVWTFREALLRFHSRTRASLGTALDSLTAPDPGTVVFHFSEPYAPLLYQLHVHEAPILPRHVYEGADLPTHPRNAAPVGTGPFRFEAYRPGSEIRLAANRDYFREGLPHLDAVVLRVVPDAGTRLLALEAGEVDWLFGVPGPDRARLEADPAYRLQEATALAGGANCIMTVGFNLDLPVLEDVRVRRAFAHAIDRRLVLDRVLFGAGRVADAPISSGIPWAHAEGLELPAFDPGRARALLGEAGWLPAASGRDGAPREARGVPGVPDGTPLRLRFHHFPAYSAYAQLFRAQLRAVGIDLVLVALEPAVAVREVFQERNFDTVLVSYCNGTDPEIGVRRVYVSSNIAPIPFSNGAAYRNDSVDALFDRARSTLGREERRRLYREIQEILVRDLPYVWIVETVSVRGYAARCEGFQAVGHFAEQARCEG